MRDNPGRGFHTDEIQRLHQALQQRGDLLRAVSDVAGHMLELRDWDGIESSLRRLGQTIGVQRVSILANQTDQGGRRRMSLRHEWSDPSVEPQIDNPAWQDMCAEEIGLGYWEGELAAGRKVAFRLSELSDRQRGIYVSQGILSMAIVPIVVQGTWWGSLVFDDCRTERPWPEAELDALQTVTRLFESFILRLRWERSLRRSEARYRDMVMALPDFIFRLDESFRFVDVQTAYPDLLHIPREQFIGRTLREVVPPDIAAIGEQECNTVVSTGKIQISGFAMQIRDEMHHFETRLVPSEDRGLLAIVRDVTEAREAERRLRESEANFRSIVQALPDLIWQTDESMRILSVQTSNPDLLIAQPDRLIGKTLAQLLPPDIAALTEQKCREAFASETMQVYDNPLEVLGGLREFETRLLPCADRKLLAVVRDVTEMRQAERRLRESEARYAAVVNDQTELICRFGPDSTLSFVNEAYCRYFGKKQEEILGNRFMPMVPAEDHDLVSWMFSSLSAEQPILIYEHRVFDAAGKVRWVEWTDRAILDPDGAIIEYQSVGRDVTDRKELERHLLETVENERKRLAQELHDGLCQDLKSLEIDAVLLENRLRAQDAPAARRAAAIGGMANQTVRAAYDIVRDMLPVGRDARGLAPALAALADSLRGPMAGRIVLALREDLQPVDDVQAHHLYRIAQGALSNALRHAHAHEIILSWDLDGELAVLSVRDDGIGFDPSRQRWESRTAGLTVLESRAQAIGARLRIDSTPGGGSEVRCLVRAWRLDEGRSES